ncbi:MAG TPA: translation initiation factor IF-3, partial [Patescibacteria group bacterium]|nr:translation initiation factor IF-3 [Patescibacteria group bacterium]
NQMIRVPQVRVVDEEGAQLGVMPTPDALAMAQERGLDLVEVAPMAAPPVVKFLDFGQYKYELTKREKEAKRKQRSVTFKEVRLKPKIGIGDFDTKVRRAIQFLEEGDRIKVAVQFRGRELTHPEIGRSLLTRFAEQIKDHGVVERAPLLEGKSMHITVASIHKPKVVDHPTKHGHEDDEVAAEAGQVGATPVAPITAPKPTNGVETPAAAPAPAATAPAAPTEPAATTEPAAPAAPAAKPAATAEAVADAEPQATPAAPVATPAKPAKPSEPAKPSAPARPAAAKAATPASGSTDGAKPAATRASATTTTTAKKSTEPTKPARASARTRKTTEPEAQAPAPAGE